MHVITATGCDRALILRRGPTRSVASLLWDRASGEITLGQWLRGRIYEYRSDLSPDGRHAIYFAGNGQRWWTAISRAPWLRAVWIEKRDHTWHGGGAFTAEGAVFLNGGGPARDLPDGLKSAEVSAYPHGTDGFHMGGLYPAMMEARGWRIMQGDRYETRLTKPAGAGWSLDLGFELRERNRSLISNRYALASGGRRLDQPDWEWAEPWQGGLQIAARGALWFVPLSANGPGKADLIHDFSDMEFETRQAPYEGVSE